MLGLFGNLRANLETSYSLTYGFSEPLQKKDSSRKLRSVWPLQLGLALQGPILFWAPDHRKRESLRCTKNRLLAHVRVASWWQYAAFCVENEGAYAAVLSPCGSVAVHTMLCVESECACAAVLSPRGSVHAVQKFGRGLLGVEMCRSVRIHVNSAQSVNERSLSCCFYSIS